MTYIAYKGFTKSLQAAGRGPEKYEIDKIYSKNESIKNPTLCTDQGYHYCDRLINTFTYYPFSNYSDHRYCEIEVLGNYTKGGSREGWKNITTSFKIIRELTKEEILEISEKEKSEKKEWEFKQKQSEIPKNLKLDIVKEIQEKYPTVIIGGSVALFLHGVRLKRWAENETSDIDVTLPYYITLEGKKEEELEEADFDLDEILYEGNDFENSTMFLSEKGYVKIDIRIDPKSKYELINYEGFDYKVALLEDILEAKIRYAMGRSGKKHKEDIYEICGKIKK